MSSADYSPENVAWLMEFFAEIIGQDVSSIAFKYDYLGDDLVYHPGGDHEPPPPGPPEPMERYLLYATQSQRLYEYMINSPANIEYFQ